MKSDNIIVKIIQGIGSVILLRKLFAYLNSK
jgi:hypothetical protein